MKESILYLRLEGPLQAWGMHQAKFLVRRAGPAPTKSGVIGLLCAAIGIGRRCARKEGWLERFSSLKMAMRADRPGVLWWDYHTVGAGLALRTAEGGTRHNAVLTAREYLCDASFLVALQGSREIIDCAENGLRAPRWPLYLGRKCCVPSRPVLEGRCDDRLDLEQALIKQPYRIRLKEEKRALPEQLEAWIEWRPSRPGEKAPLEAQVWYDVPTSFDVPNHRPRFVLRKRLPVGRPLGVPVENVPLQTGVPSAPRPRADYRNSEYRKARQRRLEMDHNLCVLCKAPATTVQHVTYRRAGGAEKLDDLRAVCRLCHDAVTMLEYGLNMGLERINPEDPRWRESILEIRAKIIAFRSLATRRRWLSESEVE